VVFSTNMQSAVHSALLSSGANLKLYKLSAETFKNITISLLGLPLHLNDGGIELMLVLGCLVAGFQLF
jgi:hypothetical protein